MSKYEQAARAFGWILDGDCGGIIYNTNAYESWKAAVSWSAECGAVSMIHACCEMECIEVGDQNG
jgi:hypothetical protein